MKKKCQYMNENNNCQLQSNIEISLMVKYAKRLIICKCSDLIKS